MSTYETLIYEKRGGVVILTLNRPECLNAFNNVSFLEMKTAVQEFEADTESRVAILRGSDRAFSAGDDIKYMTSGAVTDGDVWCALMQDCFGEIARCRKPIIAEVRGVAMGGGFELALSCDFIFVAEGTKIGLPEVNIGAIPICGGISKVAKIAGTKWAKYLAMTGDRITPEQALQIGLVQKVISTEEITATTEAFAQKLAVTPTEILFAIKRAADQSQDTTDERGLTIERDYSNYLSRIGVGAEAAKAWAEAKATR